MTYYKIRHLLYILPILTVFGGAVAVSLMKNIKPSESEFMKIEISGPYVKIKQNIIKVEIADEIREQWQGLSDRESMDSELGMLFVFPNKQVRTFVMRRMGFPLDIVWIEDNKIVAIHKNLPPEGVDPVERYSSPKPINYVLELNAGFTDEKGIGVGDEVLINL